ncbi:Alpha-dioxygenase 2 [Capsicum baccatum]|uniref:Alpha-dioxygenase 2 n=1 Tax=Capsicum baccatum TaxID=33114 RepID=A0A2G2XCV2_CAPBA|nr:Alpha-dioxygenase 2 [Capsicum baccatum]
MRCLIVDDNKHGLYPEFDDENLYWNARFITLAVIDKIHTIDFSIEIVKTDTLKVGMRINWFRCSVPGSTVIRWAYYSTSSVVIFITVVFFSSFNKMSMMPHQIQASWPSPQTLFSRRPQNPMHPFRVCDLMVLAMFRDHLTEKKEKAITRILASDMDQVLAHALTANVQANHQAAV